MGNKIRCLFPTSDDYLEYILMFERYNRFTGSIVTLL